jgi:hypothetical protein
MMSVVLAGTQKAEEVVRQAAVGILIGMIWAYLAIVFSPVWVPYQAIRNVFRIGHVVGLI